MQDGTGIKFAYKLFNLRKDGKLYPLYIDTKEPVPIGEWVHAKMGEKTANGKVKSKLGELAYRPGFHCCEYPLADHIGKKMADGRLCQKADTVWCEVMMAATHDYTEDVAKNGTNHRDRCMKELPNNGFYCYTTNPNAKVTWYITSDMQVVRIMTQEEVKDVCAKYGLVAQITEKEYNNDKSNC